MVVSQREYFQNPWWCWLNQRNEGETHPSQRYSPGKTIVCKVTEADVTITAADDSVEITRSLLGAAAKKNVWNNARWKENAKHRCRVMGRQTQCSLAHSNHLSSETNTCQGCVGRKRTRWTLRERDHQRWTRTQNDGHACVGRLHVDVGETPVGDAPSERHEWLRLQRADRMRDDSFGVPCCARATERGESENVTKRCEIHEPKTNEKIDKPWSWTLALRTAASRNCRDASAVKLQSWSSMVSGSESGRPKIEEQTGTLAVCCCRGTSSLERDLNIEWESPPDK